MRAFWSTLPPALYWPNTILFLGLASAVWIETDLYRFCLPFLLLEGIVAYYLRDHRPSIGWMGLLCGLWGLHAAIRLLLGIADSGNIFAGSAEGIYLLAMVYPTLGYALYLHRAQSSAYALLFVLTSLAMLLVSVDLTTVLTGERVAFLFHANTIHASVGAGFIVLAATAILLHAWDGPAMAPWLRAALTAAGLLTVVLALFGIVGAKSKGVWLALALAVPFLLLVSFLLRSRPRVSVLMGALVMLGIGLVGFLFRGEIANEIVPNAQAALAIVSRILEGLPPHSAFVWAIDAGFVPESFAERLRLWANALDVWHQSPLVGSGVEWFRLWEQAGYLHSQGALIHNGYLEIAVRYGVLGLLFYGATFAWSAWQGVGAYRERLIGSSILAFHLASIVFFLLTLATNSNNRLAIGESFMLLSGAFGFYCHFLRADRRSDAAAPETVSSSPEPGRAA